MDAVALSQYSTLNLPSFSALRKTRFWSIGRPNFPPKVKEITDGPLPFASNKDRHHPVVSSKKADGDRKGISPQSSSRRRIPEENDKGNQSSKNPEEIISLFRRIQSSISTGPVISKKRSSKPSEYGPSVESVLEVLHQSRTKVKGKTARKDGDRILAQQRGTLTKEQKANYPSVLDTKLTRPPSSFLRRSPIPQPNQGVPVNLRSEQLPTTDDQKETKIPDLKELALQKVEKMKLPELKELAKSRGIKGYSRLRKAELVKLLITS